MSNTTLALSWHLGFYALFLCYPFFSVSSFKDQIFPWAVSALSGPLHFYLIYYALRNLLPEFNAMGLVPAALALPALAGLVFFVRKMDVSPEQRTRLLAWAGASLLFFITMIFPIQFSRQWLTIGWALEGLALAWLYLRVPHRGLPVVSVALLIVSFARLGLNLNVFSYYPRSEVRIWNWYLYSYGTVTVCLLAAARLLTPSRSLVFGKNVQPLLYSLGTVLAFMLLNIEIADFFAGGPVLQFDFSGRFDRDMTYSIAWALFALLLLVVGIRKESRAARYSALGLLGITLLKLFFHDLSQLGQLYRVGAFMGVAVILIFASWIYQKYLATVSERKA